MHLYSCRLYFGCLMQVMIGFGLVVKMSSAGIIIYKGRQKSDPILHTLLFGHRYFCVLP